MRVSYKRDETEVDMREREEIEGMKVLLSPHTCYAG
jgi:hypothetical protein